MTRRPAMFGVPLELFRLFGIPIRLDRSWFIIGVLVVWSLAVGFFPTALPDQSRAAYWAMGVAGAVGLFASIIVHELFHALVARRYLIPIRGITLFIFGGVAEMEGEPREPAGELRMAVAGPLASVAIALLAFGAAVGLDALGPGRWAARASGVLGYLALINGVLAVFNMLPAFPLDGGRVLRALLWRRHGDLKRATRMATRAGTVFSVGFMVLGGVRLLTGDVLGGIWWFLIGMFLRGASAASYQHVLLRHALEGEPVSRFMTREPVTVPPHTSVAELVEGYVYRHHHKLFPVTDNGRLLGCVSTQEIKAVPQEDWGRRTVGQLAVPCGPDNTIGPATDAMEALALMKRTGQGRLLVGEHGRLAGVVTLKDLLDFFALKVELEP